MTNEKLKVIITGATGMVGEGVLMECLVSDDVESVLVINRRHGGQNHPKLKEIIHEDFFDFSPIESQLKGYDTCFFCLGVSSVGMAKETYERLTYDLTMHVAEVLSRQNHDMTFCYISGAGTDSSEKKGMHWARVKGKTENGLGKLSFKRAFALRPGFILPIKGQKNAHKFYRYVNWIFPIGRSLMPGSFCRLTELGRAMIELAKSGYDKHVIEGRDIIRLGS